MLGRLATHAHRLWVVVETLLHGLEHVFVLPSRDPTLGSGGATRLDGAVRTCRRPIAAQRLAVLLARVPVGQLLARRATVDILWRQIDEILLAEPAVRLRARCHRLRQRHRDVGLLAGQNLRTVVVAAVSDGIEIISAKNVLRLRCHSGELCRPRVPPPPWWNWRSFT